MTYPARCPHCSEEISQFHGAGHVCNRIVQPAAVAHIREVGAKARDQAFAEVLKVVREWRPKSLSPRPDPVWDDVIEDVADEIEALRAGAAT